MAKAKPGYKLELSNFQQYEEIPDNWSLKTLGEVGAIVGGGTPKTTVSEYWDGDILWASPSDLTNIKENYIDDTERKITQKGLDESTAKIIESGNLIFSSRATVGECKINTKPLATNQGFQNIIPKKDYDNLFIFYAMLLNKIKFVRFAYGTTFLEINKNNVKKIKIIFPEEKSEQQKIASILSNVDKLISSYEYRITLSKKLKNGLMQKLLIKGIETKKFQKIKWLFQKEIEIPVHWEVQLLGNTSRKIIDGTHFTPNYVEQGIPFLRVTDIQKFPIDWNSVKRISLEEHNDLIKRCNPEKNDILYSKNGTLGIPRLVDWEDEFSCFVSLCLIKLKQDVITSDFLIQFLKTNLIKKQIIKRSKQLGVPNLHLEEIREFQILIPPIPEQQKIASILSNVDEKINDLESKKSNLEKIKKGLMQKLLTGQIRVAA